MTIFLQISQGTQFNSPFYKELENLVLFASSLSFLNRSSLIHLSLDHRVITLEEISHFLLTSRRTSSNLSLMFSSHFLSILIIFLYHICVLQQNSEQLCPSVNLLSYALLMITEIFATSSSLSLLKYSFFGGVSSWTLSILPLVSLHNSAAIGHDLSVVIGYGKSFEFILPHIIYPFTPLHNLTRKMKLKRNKWLAVLIDAMKAPFDKLINILD